MTHTLIRKSVRRAGVVLMLAAGLGACTMTTGNAPSEGIGYRQARLAEMSAMQAWRDCRDEAMALDSEATSSGAARAISPAPGRSSAAKRISDRKPAIWQRPNGCGRTPPRSRTT